MKAISDTAKRKAEALKLHTTHWAIASGAQPFPVDGSEAEELLQAKVSMPDAFQLLLLKQVESSLRLLINPSL